MHEVVITAGFEAIHGSSVGDYQSVCSEFNFTWTLRLPSMLLLKLPRGISSKCNYYKTVILSNCFGVNYIHFICRLEGIHDKCMDLELKPTLIYAQHKSSLLASYPYMYVATQIY
mgnify:CR=1 FL=1